MQSPDRILRAAAYDVISSRDGVVGWKRHREALLASARKSLPALEADADTAVHRMVVHAYGTVPYYRAAWDERGCRPTPGFGRRDLPGLPFIDKDVLRKHKSSLVSSDYRLDELVQSATGGTTGTQTAFYLDQACRIARVGRQWGILELCGYRPGMRRGLVWGVHDDLLGAGSRFSPRRWFRQFAGSDETLCCTILNPEIMAEYHARLRRFRPQVLYGYPSALSQLARWIDDRRLEPIRVATVITTAERLTDAQRSDLGRLFGAEVFNLYCTREYGCIGFECHEHNGLHVDTESVIVEIVRDGQPVAPGESGEITITDLQNRGMPFIRSRTGDIGALSARSCPCGLAQPLLTGLDGRSTDVLYRTDGSTVAGLMLTDLFQDLPAVRYSCFVQERVGELDVLLIATADYSHEMERDVVRQVRDLMGDGIEIKVRRVAELPRNPRSGKFQEVICRIANPAPR
jgi:phenylacetate-CoA ligase